MPKVITCRIDNVFEEKLRHESEKKGISFSSYLSSILSAAAGNLEAQSDKSESRFDQLEASIETLNNNIRIIGNLSTAILKVLDPENADGKIRSIIDNVKKGGE